MKSVKTEELSKLFLVKPYLQLGQQFAVTTNEHYEVLWHTYDMEGDFQVQYRAYDETDNETGAQSWKPQVSLIPTLVRTSGSVAPHYRYQAVIGPIAAGKSFTYRVYKDKVKVFEASGKAAPRKDQPWRFIAIGDIGDGGKGARANAHAIQAYQPQLLLIPGDVVYDRGRVGEYLKHFFPILNSDRSARSHGAPLMRSTITVAAPGNHDVGTPVQTESLNWKKFPDMFGFYLFWSHPTNGPALPQGLMGRLLSSARNRKKMLALRGNTLSDGSNFHFRFGNAHFVVLDANMHMDWTKPLLRQWLKDALQAGSDAQWRIVTFHQPPFNSDRKYNVEQRMRMIADIMQAGKVDLVLGGHCHYYERSAPIRVDGGSSGLRLNNDGTVSARLNIDDKYDGRTITSPDGIIYVVTGSGSRMVDEGHLPTRSSFTRCLNITDNSFTVIDVDGARLTLRQLTPDNKEIDKITIDKSGSH
jgi:hypothetical protein